MTQQIINTGSGPNAQDGDSLYVAFNKVNENFSNIWAQGPVDSNISIANNAIISTDVNGNIVLMPNGIGYAQINATAIPGANNTYFLGDSSRRWRGIYAGSAGINTTGNLYAGNLIIAGNTTYSGDITFNGNVGVAQSLSVAGNITGDENLYLTGSLTAGPATFGGNVAITGNLQVAGNIIYIDVEQLRVHDPIIEIGTGPNGAPLTTSDGYSRGLLMDYFNTTANSQQLGFMGLAGPNYTTYQFLTNATDLGNVFTGTPANLTFGNATASGLLSATGNIIGGNIVTVGNVSASANISGANLLTGGNISATGGLVADTLYANTSIASGNTISAAGNITGAYLLGNGRFLSGIDTTLISNGTSRVQVVTADGNIIANVAGNTIATWTANGYSVAGNISTDSYYIGNGRYLTGVVADSIGNVLASISVSGNANVGNLNTSGVISATGNITGNYILGNGALLTGIDTSLISNGTSNVHIATANGNITMAVNGTANVVEVSTTGVYINGTVSTTGNAAVLGILTDNYYYANGQPLDMQQPAGSNTWVQYNDNNDFGASAAFTFDSSANALAVSGNISGGNLRTTGLVSATGNVIGGNLRTTGAVVGGTGSFLSDVTIYGNLQVGGNIVYVDVSELRVVDPVIELGGGPNGTPLTADDGFSRGLKLDYFNDTANAAQFGFMGLAATDFTTYQFLTNATDTSNVFTGTAANLYFGNASATGNIATAGILTDGYYYANGQPLDMQQPSGSNTWIQYNDNGNFGATTNFTFDADNQVFYIGGFATITGNIIGGNLQTAGYVSAAGNIYGATLFGDVQGNIVSDAISVSGNIDAGNLRTAGQVTATGNITGGNVLSSGIVSATGNATFGNISTGGNVATAGILTDNYYYANGQPLDMQQPAGSNTQIQFNNNNDFGASANLTFDTATNQFTVGGAISANGNITFNNWLYTPGGTNLVVSPGVSQVRIIANTEPYHNDSWDLGASNARWKTFWANTGNFSGSISSVGNLKSGNLLTGGVISATGNVIGGNIATGGIISASGNVTTAGILTDNYYYANGQPLDMQQPAGSNTWIQFNNNNDFGASANLTFDSSTNQFYVNGIGSFTGNITGGNIHTGGTISAAGNIDGGNLSGENIIGTLSTNAQPNITSVGILNSLSVTGNVKSGNLLTGGYISSTGNVTGGNVLTAGLISSTGNITSSANIAGGNIATNGTVSAGGNVTGANLLTSGIVSAMGNAIVNGILTDNYYYANGAPVDFEQPAGSNTQIQFNDNNDFGASANLTFNNSTNVLSVGGNIIGANLLTNGVVSATSNITGGNVLTGGIVSASGNITSAANVSGVTFKGNVEATTISASGNVVGGNVLTGGIVSATGNLSAGNISTAIISASGTITGGNVLTGGIVSATGNITGNNISAVGAVISDTLQTTGNAIIGGNLVVNGNVTYINITDLNVQDPIISMGRGPNDSPLVADDGKDRGEQLWYYKGSENSAFIGWQNTSNTLIAATSASVSNNIVTVNEYGSFRAGNILGQSISLSSNVTGGNILTSGLISAAGNINSAANISGVTFKGNVEGSYASLSANVTGGNLLTGGIVSATATITGGNIATGGTVSAGGNVTGANLLTGGIVSASGNITSAANVSGVTFKGNVEATTISASGAVTGNTVSAIGNITGGNVAGTTLSGNLVGTTASLSANVTGGNLITSGLISSTGNLTAGNITTAGQANLGNIVISGDDITDTNGRVNFNTALNNVDFAVSGTNANVFYVDAGTNTVSIGNSTQTTGATLAINATDSALMPIGNSFQRPTGVPGMVRFNSTLDTLEFYTDVSGWISAGATEIGNIISQTFTADGSTVAFSLTNPSTTIDSLVMINGVTQVPAASYSIVGTTLTFTEPPEAGDTIEVRELAAQSTVHAITNSSGNASVSVDDSAAQVNIIGNLIPGANVTYNLGSPTAQWNDLYLSGNTIYIGGNTLSVAAGNLTFNGNIVSDYVYGNGAFLTGIAASYGNANVVANLAALGSNPISTTGNITGGNLSIAGNVVGDIAFTGGNVFINNNAGAGGSDEGGQINFAAATANSTLSGPIALDIYQNKMRFFETAGNNRGMYIDIANAMGVAGSSTGVPAIGYRDVPQVSFSANATAAASDAGKHYYSTTAGNLALTLPDNSNVAFSTGATLTIVVNAAGNVLVNAAAGVTLYMAGSSTAGNRVVGAYGLASVMKVAANTWVISGTGVY